MRYYRKNYPGLRPIVVRAEYRKDPSFIHVDNVSVRADPGWIVFEEDLSTVYSVRFPRVCLVPDSDHFHKHYQLLCEEELEEHFLKKRAIQGDLQAIVTLFKRLEDLQESKNPSSVGPKGLSHSLRLGAGSPQLSSAGHFPDVP